MAREESGPGGCAPDSCRAALILVDVINPFDFERGDRLLANALKMAPMLVDLKARCEQLGIPSIYVNDHFGRWRSDFSAVVDRCQDQSALGRDFVCPLVPQSQDYFVFKPMHSGFFQTTLQLLLEHLGAKNLVLTGLASNICVLATAQDAYMRNYRLWIPNDTTAAATSQEKSYSELHFEAVLRANTVSAQQLDLAGDLQEGTSR